MGEAKVKGEKLKKRNLFLPFITLSIVLILIVVFVKFKNQESTVESINDFIHLENIDKMDIVNGGNGTINEITDLKTLNSMKEYVSSLDIKHNNREQSTGFHYMLRLYNSDEIETTIIFVNPSLISMSGTYYDIISSNGFEVGNVVAN